MIHFEHWPLMVGYTVFEISSETRATIKGVKYTVPKDNVSICINDDPTFYPVRLFMPVMNHLEDLTEVELLDIFTTEIEETIEHPGLAVFAQGDSKTPVATIDSSSIKLIELRKKLDERNCFVMILQRVAMIDGQEFPLQSPEETIFKIDHNQDLSFLNSIAYLKCLKYRVDVWGYINRKLAKRGM